MQADKSIYLPTLHLSVPGELVPEVCLGVGVSLFWRSLEQRPHKVCNPCKVAYIEGLAQETL